MEECFSLLVGLFFCTGICLSTTIPIPSTAEASNGMTEYILYTHAQTWNTAKRVCAETGGQLVKMDSPKILDQIRTEAEGSWSSIWHHMWTGLHSAQDGSLIHQDCTPFDFETLGTEMFKTTNHYEFKSNQQCLRMQKDQFLLERHDCKKKMIFLCERKSGYCQYNTVNTSVALISQFNASSWSCRSVCDAITGCYLAGNYLTSHCVLLKAPGEENPMSVKVCFSASTNTSDTDAYKGDDDASTLPTTCDALTADNSSSVGRGESSVSLLSATEVECPSSSFHVYTSSEVICSTEVVTLTPSVNDVTVVVTSAITDTVTEWLRETKIVSLTEISTAVLTSAETLTTTETTVEVVNTCTMSLTPESSCVTEITSTNVYTTISNCESVSPEYFTITSSCMEQSIVIIPTTVTSHESTSCCCQMTSVVSPEPPSTFSTSASHLPTSIEPRPTETTVCTTYTSLEPTEETIDAIVSSIVKVLTVKTKNLSSTKRKKTSAKDLRVSSMCIGYGALAITVVGVSLLILADVFVIIKDCRKCLSNIKRKGAP